MTDAQTPSTRLPRPVKWAGIALTAIVVLLLAVWLVVRSPIGQNMLASALEDALSDPETHTVTKVEGLTGNPLGALTIASLVITESGQETLVARDIAIDWSPWALLSGLADIETVTVGSLTLHEAPDAPEKIDEPSDLIPDLSVDLRIDQATIGQLRFPGEGPAFRFRGQASLERAEAVALDAALETDEGAGEHVDVTLRYLPDRDVLDLDADVVTLPGGALARFTLPDALGGLTLKAKGTGTPDHWQGTLQAKVKDTQLADLALEVKGKELGVAGSVDPRPLLDDPSAADLAGTIAIDARVTFEDGAPASYTATLRNDAVEARFEGGLVTTTQLETTRFEISARDPDALAAALGDWSLDGLAAKGTIAPGDAGTQIAFSLSMQGLRSPDGDIDALTGDVIVGLTDTAATVQGDGSIAFGAPLPQPAAPANWSLTGAYGFDSGQLTVGALSVRQNGTALTASGQATFAPLAARASADLKLADLASWQALTGLPGIGAVEAHVAVDWSDAGNRHNVDIAATGAGLALEDPQLNALIGPAPALNLVLDRRTDGTGLALAGELKAAGVVFNLDGSLDEPLETIDARYDARFPAPNRLLDPAAEVAGDPLSVAGTIKGTLAAPTITAQARAESLGTGGLSVGRLDLKATIDDPFAAPHGRMDMSFVVRGEDVSGGAVLKSDDTGWRIEDIALNGATLELSGGLASVPDSSLIRGSLDLQLRQSKLLGVLAGFPVIGTASGHVELAAEQDLQRLRFDFALRDYELWSPNQRRYEGETATLTGSLTLGETVSIDRVDFASGEVRSGDLQLTKATFGIAPEGPGLAIAADLAGDFDGPVTLMLRAQTDSVRLSTPLTLTLTALSGTVAGQQLDMPQPATLQMTGDRTLIDPLVLTYDGGRLETTLDYGPDRKILQLTAHDLDLGLVSLLLTDENVTGKANLDLALDLMDQPTGTMSIKLDDLLVGEELTQDPIDVTLDARFEPDARLTATAAVVTAERRALEASAELPVILGPDPFSLEVDVKRPVNLHLAGQAELDDLWPLSGEYDHVLGGTANADFTLSGTIEDPVIVGTFSLAKATYRNLTTGFRMLADRIGFDLRDGLLQLEPTHATDGNGGTIDVSGWVRPFAPGGVQADLTAELNKAKMIRLRDVKMSASGKVRYQREAEKEEMTGTVTINDAEVALVDRLPPDVVDLDVVELHRPEGLITLPEKPTGEATQTKVKIGISAANQVFVRGRGLESEWKGNVNVAGTLDEPRLTGKLQVVRGDFQFAGKRFVLDEGTLQFTGARQIDPQILLTATYEVETLTAQIKLSGPISKPSLTLTSRPALPQDEILSRIMFGTNSDQLSALQAAQLAAAAASMSGSGGGFDVVGKIRSALMLERLEIGTTGEDGTSPLIRGGKYLTKNVYVEVGTARDEEGASSASIDAELTKHLTIGTEATTTGNRKLRLRWKWDY